MKQKTQHLDLTYHPRCAALNISHVAFANDLFVLCGDDIRFLELVKEAICQFGNASGLKPNLQKSSMFITGVDEDMKIVLSDYIGMEMKEFPVRYLRVPLISTKLRVRGL